MTTRSQIVARALRERLIAGSFPGGTKLNEVDLAERYGVSRTPIRAALHALASEGFLDHRPNAGFMVRSFSSKFIAGVYDVRAALEGLAAGLAAERGVSDSVRGRMHRLMIQTDELIAESPRDSAGFAALMELNNQFHVTFIEAADNQHLADTLRRTRELPLVDRIKADVFDFDFSARAHEDHRWIFDAICTGQGARAEALAREHVRRGAARIMEYARAEDIAQAARAEMPRRRAADAASSRAKASQSDPSGMM
jgi:GntR family transcriptional regulator of vanillate catabolism